MKRPKFRSGDFVYVLIDAKEIRRAHIDRVWLDDAGSWRYGLTDVVGGVEELRIYEEWSDAVDAVMPKEAPDA